MTKTFYDVLGVAPDASTADIRAAYRDRLKEAHPDLNDDDNANATTRRIIRARDVLTDETERERYDRVGHDEFVGTTDEAVDEDDLSNAATAARRAGWATGGEYDQAPDQHQSHSRTESRRQARQRRHRERTAEERVGTEQTDGTHETARTRGTGETAGTNGTGGSEATHRANAADEERQDSTTASTDGGSAGFGGGRDRVSRSARSWNGSGGYSVRQQYETGSDLSDLVPRGKSLTLAAVALVLYPLMLFSALFPPFPLFVNIVVGMCVVFLVGYLQSRPEVGVIVFGTWSVLSPLALAFVGVPLTGLVGVLALAGTWLPLGLSALTLVMFDL